MGTLATVELVRDRSFQREVLVYDVKRGGFSILASAGCFSAALLEQAGITNFVGLSGIVDVPDDVEVLGPFATFMGMNACVEVDGVMASVDKPAEYACWTQIGVRLKRLIVHPRLKDSNLHIEAEIYECVGWGGSGDKVREKFGSRRKCDLSTDGSLRFDGTVVEPAERISIRVIPANATLVRSTDFLLLMSEMK